MSERSAEPAPEPPAAANRPRLALPTAGALAILYTGWLLWMTLRGQREAYATVYTLVSAAGLHRRDPTLLIDIVGNVAVFVPLGVLVAAVARGRGSRRAAAAVAVAALLSGFIEIAQRAVPGRVSSLRDWLLNVLGAALGAAAVVCWRAAGESSGQRCSGARGT